jgi:hypothetical protein
MTFSEECTEAPLHTFTFGLRVRKEMSQRDPRLQSGKSDVKESNDLNEEPIIVPYKP